MRLNKCGHPQDWVIKLKGYGRTHTFCLACLMDKVGLKCMETYDIPAVKQKKEVDEICPIKMEKDPEKEVQKPVPLKKDLKKEIANK